ncbi:MAG: hypothetical protein RL722_2817 [Pseudomonadota bacterium]|jgi:hypothetical protein
MSASRHPSRAAAGSSRRALITLPLLLAGGLMAGSAQAEGELRLVHEITSQVTTASQVTAGGPSLAATNASTTAWRSELAWRQNLSLKALAQGLSLGLDGVAAHRWVDDGSAGASADLSRLNELQLGLDLPGAQGSAWALSAGRKIMSWDVGYAWRPNDVVQQEVRRSLLTSTPQGRPLLAVEHYGAAQDSAALVWVNPQHADGGDANSARGAEESALAARSYARQGALDIHTFARVGRRTAASLGGALAWVADEALELHASARWLQRDLGWMAQGPTGQILLGAQWTGAARQSLLVEAWHDGTAPSNAQWRAWGNHPRAAGLGPNLRRDNLYARLAWQPEAGAGRCWPEAFPFNTGTWQLSLDTLFTPADEGRITSAGLQWQGDRIRLDLALRQRGGRAGSVLALLPGPHHQAVLQLGLPF